MCGPRCKTFQSGVRESTVDISLAAVNIGKADLLEEGRVFSLCWSVTCQGLRGIMGGSTGRFGCNFGTKNLLDISPSWGCPPPMIYLLGAQLSLITNPDLSLISLYALEFGTREDRAGRIGARQIRAG